MSEPHAHTKSRSGMILLADLTFLFAIFFITRDLSLQLLDILAVALVVVSLFLLAYQTFLRPGRGLSAFIDAAQTIIAGAIALRFLVLFLGDLAALASLFLYGAIILFFFIAVNGAWNLFMNRRALKPSVTTEENTTEIVPDTTSTPATED